MQASVDEARAWKNAVGRPPFERLMAAHWRALELYRRAAIVLVVLGAVAIAFGLDVVPHPWPRLSPLIGFAGLALVGTALVPLKEILERRDRIEGLEVLSDEWRDMVLARDRVGITRVRALLDRLYR